MRCILIAIATLHPGKVSRSHPGLVAVHGLLHLSSGYGAILNLMLDFALRLLKLTLDLPLICLYDVLIVDMIRAEHQIPIVFNPAL